MSALRASLAPHSTGFAGIAPFAYLLPHPNVGALSPSLPSFGEPLVEVKSDVAELPLEAAAVGPRGDQAIISGGDLLLSPQCPVGFDLNLSISSDELLKQPSCSRQLSNPSITQSMFSYNHFFY